jgi:hypothetical protein
MRRVFVVIGVAVVGCGGMKGPDVAAYRTLGAEVASTVESHRIASATLSGAECAAERDRYAAELRPMLQRMTSMSGDMDACMDEMGHAGSGDLQSTCASMRAELDGHLAAACATADIAGEAARHATAMAGMVAHEMDAAGTMQGMMGSGGMMSGGDCHR